jgi:glycosyltransferase involved in cell wall biosynthesis
LSVLSQLYSNIEYILIDGGSTDRSLEIVKQYHDSIDYWISEPDNGIYEAWNKGILASNGEWIGFLGAGDIYFDHAIENYVNRVYELGDTDLEYISSRNELISKSGKVLRVIGTQWEWKRFRRFMNVAHVGSLHHKALFQRYGLFDPTYRICGDYELLLRPRDKLRTGFVNKVTAQMRIGGVSHNWTHALTEARLAKRRSGRRKELCNIEMCVAMAKFWIRSSMYYLYDKCI